MKTFFKPKKRLGQNFLLNNDILEKITSLINIEGEEIVESLGERILGRTSSEKIVIDGEVVVKPGDIFDEKLADLIVENNFNGIVYDQEKDSLKDIIQNIENRDVELISQNAIATIKKNNSLEKIADLEFTLYIND